MRYAEFRVPSKVQLAVLPHVAVTQNFQIDRIEGVSTLHELLDVHDDAVRRQMGEILPLQRCGPEHDDVDPSRIDLGVVPRDVVPELA
ncbi:hypothetical protein D3C72_1730680 [compost metagenome]